MKVAVVGRGLIGSAAARHLAKAGHAVTLIGPDEPAGDWTRHRGAFASHYDEGRIARTIDHRRFYAVASAAAIGRYDEIARESGIAFFTECGALVAGGPERMAAVKTASRGLAAEWEILDPAALCEAFPFLSFPEGQSAAWEPRRAGHVSPRRLVAAQTEAARRHGARVIAAEATGVGEGRVDTAAGRIECDRVLVATGGWTDALLGGDGRLTVRPRTVAFFEIGPGEAARLAAMPSILVESANGTYVLPPIRYPDGRLWLKLGGDPVDRVLSGAEEINAW